MSSPKNPERTDRITEGSTSVQNILSPEEQKNLDSILRDIQISKGKIEYRGITTALNVRNGKEFDAKYLLAQLIVRGKFDLQKKNINNTINTALGTKYYQGDNGHIDAKSGIVLDTTVATPTLIARIFDHKKELSAQAYENEEAIVAKILADFLNATLTK